MSGLVNRVLNLSGYRDAQAPSTPAPAFEALFNDSGAGTGRDVGLEPSTKRPRIDFGFSTLVGVVCALKKFNWLEHFPLATSVERKDELHVRFPPMKHHFSGVPYCDVEHCQQQLSLQLPGWEGSHPTNAMVAPCQNHTMCRRCSERAPKAQVAVAGKSKQVPTCSICTQRLPQVNDKYTTLSGFALRTMHPHLVSYPPELYNPVCDRPRLWRKHQLGCKLLCEYQDLLVDTGVTVKDRYLQYWDEALCLVCGQEMMDSEQFHGAHIRQTSRKSRAPVRDIGDPRTEGFANITPTGSCNLSYSNCMIDYMHREHRQGIRALVLKKYLECVRAEDRVLYCMNSGPSCQLVNFATIWFYFKENDVKKELMLSTQESVRLCP